MLHVLLLFVLVLAPATVVAQEVPDIGKVENLQVSGASDQIMVSWNEVTSRFRLSYVLQWKSGSQAYDRNERQIVFAQGTSGTITDDDRFTPGVAYTFRMRAASSGENGAFSDEVVATLTLPDIGKVENLQVSGTSDQIMVSWDAVTHSLSLSYALQWKSGSQAYDQSAREIVFSQGTSGTITDDDRFTPGVAYTFRMYATVMGASGPFSDEVVATLMVPDIGKVGNLQVSGTSDQIMVSWDAVTHSLSLSYALQWKSGSQAYDQSAREIVFSQGTSGAIMDDDRFTPGVAYAFRMYATVMGASGPFSDEVVATLMVPDIGKATNLQVSGASDRIMVSWDEIAHSLSLSYALQWKSGSQAYDQNEREIVFSQGTSGTIMDDDRFTAGVAYTFRMYATAMGSSGPFSDEVVVTLMVPDIGKVMNLQVSGRFDQITVSWDEVSHPLSLRYALQWKSGSQAYDQSTREIVFTQGTSGAITNDDRFTAGVAYTFRMYATVQDASGPFSDEVVATFSAPPPPPVVPPSTRPAVVIAPTELTVSEPEGMAVYTAVLATSPTGAVTVRAMNSDAVQVSPRRVFYTTVDWHIPQTVTVTAVDDDVDNPDDQRTASITHSVAGYGDVVTAETVTVTVTDDDGSTAVPALPVLGSVLLGLLTLACGFRFTRRGAAC